METKLIKLNSEFYLIDSDSNNSKAGEINYDQTIRDIVDEDDLAHSDCFKVLASTEKLKELPLLNKANIERLLGKVDVEKLAIQKVGVNWVHLFNRNNELTYKRPLPTLFWNEVDIWISGYTKSTLDKADKKFTLEDIHKAIEFGFEKCKKFGDITTPERSGFIQSITTKEQYEWECEIDVISSLPDNAMELYKESLETRQHIGFDAVYKPLITNGYITIKSIK